MDRMLYVAMTGARETMLAQAINANNLANVSTTAFRGDLAAARSMPVYGEGQPSRVYAMTERPGIDLRPGVINQTGRELDVAVRGEGWIAVQARDGSEAYTRAGDLRVSTAGLLVTGAGHPVLGNAGPIALPPAKKVEIAVDGTISVLGLDQNPNAVAVLDRIKLVNPPLDQLEKGTDGLLRSTTEAVVAPDASARLATGALEGSNVSAVEAMVEMVALSRRFEAQVKMMTTAEQTDEAAARLLKLA
ncbi:MAG: flagellar biosynthesis protein FlgF [Gammaproteobacteria bacterium SG8_47]|nr:MAG: flagellar biosynthesis protein FlgF [Gammaproteobacteria bacterium SG8_47]